MGNLSIYYLRATTCLCRVRVRYLPGSHELIEFRKPALVFSLLFSIPLHRTHQLSGPLGIGGRDYLSKVSKNDGFPKLTCHVVGALLFVSLFPFLWGKVSGDLLAL